jgi:hypothetical protein
VVDPGCGSQGPAAPQDLDSGPIPQSAGPLALAVPQAHRDWPCPWPWQKPGFRQGWFNHWCHAGAAALAGQAGAAGASRRQQALEGLQPEARPARLQALKHGSEGQASPRQAAPGAGVSNIHCL